MEVERNCLDSVLMYMIDGVIVMDCCGKVIMINEMVFLLLNVKNENVIGILLLELLDIEEDYILWKLLEELDELLIDCLMFDCEED